jgi:hypothetical protein
MAHTPNIFFFNLTKACFYLYFLYVLHNYILLLDGILLRRGAFAFTGKFRL